MKNKNKVRIGLIQMSPVKDPARNLQKAVSLIETAASRGAEIIALPELFRTLYFCQKKDPRNFRLAETIPGPTTKVLSKLAGRLKVVLIVPLFEKTKGRTTHNTAVVLDADGRLIGKYRKMHIPYDPGFYEKFYFTRGDLGFRVFKTRYGKIAAMICWDQWFPEAARSVALSGAEILFYPTAIGWKPEQKKETLSYHAAWELVQRSHAIANSVYVAAVNRVGREGALKFWGSSFVAGPFGEILGRAGNAEEEVVTVDCDLKKIKATRKEWPFFRDRRTDAYAR